MAARCKIGRRAALWRPPGRIQHGDLRRRLDRDREAGGFTGIGIFGDRESLTISNGGVLNSQGGAEVNSFFGGPATVVGDRRRDRTWNIGGFGLSVGGGTTGGPGTLTISDGGVRQHQRHLHRRQ